MQVTSELRLIVHADAAACRAAVMPYLELREAEHSMLLGQLDDLTPPSANRDAAAPAAPLFLAELRLGDRTVGVAAHTPRMLSLSRLDCDPAAAARRLVAALHAVQPTAPGVPGVPGVVGPDPAAAAFADAWTVATGCTSPVNVGLRIYELTALAVPARVAAVAGRARLATAADLDHAAEWTHAFGVESHREDPSTPAADRRDAATRIAAGKLYYWEVDGQAVAMAALGRESRRGILVNAVYTPPAQRGRGYASALTAHVTAAGLRRGKEFCVLYTDLNNKTVNHIYPALGYRPVGAARFFRFLPAK